MNVENLRLGEEDEKESLEDGGLVLQRGRRRVSNERESEKRGWRKINKIKIKINFSFLSYVALLEKDPKV